MKSGQASYFPPKKTLAGSNTLAYLGSGQGMHFPQGEKMITEAEEEVCSHGELITLAATNYSYTSHTFTDIENSLF